MRSLAGNPDADQQIRTELEFAGITIESGPRQPGEVPATLYGELSTFSFRRDWGYWRVNGLMPLDVAQVLHDDPSAPHIRAGGHAGGVPPAEQVSWLTVDLEEVLPTSQREGCERIVQQHPKMQEAFDNLVFSDDPESLGARPYVVNYHIDSVVALKIFADTIRQRNL